MTKTHFENIARCFAQQMSNPTIPTEGRQALIANANMQADYFFSINGNFNRAQFLTACGMA